MKIKANNIEINCELSGNPNGETVVLSHSLGSSGIMWKPQLPVLETDFNVLRIDTRGHGQSSAPAGKYSMNDLIADMVAVLDALEFEKVHWVGLSMGGMIGQGLGIHHSNRLNSLCLCDTMSLIRDHTMPVWTKRVEICEKHGMESMVESAMERWFTDSYRKQPPTPEYKEIREQIQMMSTTGYLGCCHAIINMNFLNQLEQIQVPTHIIVGDQDMATPVSESKVMHGAIANSTLEIIRGAAHFSNVEQADTFNHSLVSFLYTL